MPAAPPVTRATRPSSVPLVLVRCSCVSVIEPLPCCTRFVSIVRLCGQSQNGARGRKSPGTGAVGLSAQSDHLAGAIVAGRGPADGGRWSLGGRCPECCAERDEGDLAKGTRGCGPAGPYTAQSGSAKSRMVPLVCLCPR